MSLDRRRRRIRALTWRLGWHLAYPPLIRKPWRTKDQNAYDMEVTFTKRRPT